MNYQANSSRRHYRVLHVNLFVRYDVQCNNIERLLCVYLFRHHTMGPAMGFDPMTPGLQDPHFSQLSYAGKIPDARKRYLRFLFILDQFGVVIDIADNFKITVFK